MMHYQAPPPPPDPPPEKPPPEEPEPLLLGLVEAERIDEPKDE